MMIRPWIALLALVGGYPNRAMARAGPNASPLEEEVAANSDGATQPVPLQSMAALLSGVSYPASVLGSMAQRVTVVTVGVDVFGRVTSCKVSETSGSEVLDLASCSIMTSRARYQPAKNKDGKAVEGLATQRLVWKSPMEMMAYAPAAPPAPPAPRAVIDKSRHWVQIASGAKSSLPGKLERQSEKAPGLVGGRYAWFAPLRASYRLLIGPFDSEAKAQEFVAELAKAGLSGSHWKNPEGQRVDQLR